MIYYLLYVSLPISTLAMISFINLLKDNRSKTMIYAISTSLLNMNLVFLILLQLIITTPNYYNIMLLLSYITTFTIMYGNIINHRFSIVIFVTLSMSPIFLLSLLPSMTAVYLIANSYA